MTPKEKYDSVEERTRSSDYEGTPGRTREGREGELDLSRVNIDSGGKAKGDAGGDWEGNFAPKGMTAVDGTGYVSDTRGASSYTGGHEDVDPELHREMRDSGLRLGVNSVDTNSAAFALINARYMKNKLAWERTPPWKRELMNAERRDKRASRSFEQKREDSIHRHASEHYRLFAKQRLEDDPYFLFLDPEVIAEAEGVDSRSAHTIALRWKQADDEKKLGAMVTKYAAALEGIKPRSMQTKLRRKPELRQAAEIVFVCDAHACGVVLPGGFDRERLLANHGDELYELETEMSIRIDG